MKIPTGIITVFVTVLLTGAIAHAQLATQKGITLGEIGERLGKLAEKTDAKSRAQLNFEAAALAKSDDERFVVLSAKVYTFLGEEKKAARIQQSIPKRFPKGTTARLNAFNKLFDKESRREAAVVEQQYNKWLKKFPEIIEEGEHSQPIYSQALTEMALVYFNEGDTASAMRFVRQAEQRENFAQYANVMGRKLIADSNYTAAQLVLKPGYNLSAESAMSSDPAVKNSNDARSLVILAQNYAKVLSVLGDDPELIKVLSFFVKTPFGGTTNNVIDLAEAYIRQGRKLDAFLAYDSYLRAPRIQGRDETVISKLEPLYSELNGTNASFTNYIAGIRASVDDVLTAKFEEEMIKRPAPAFSVKDREGNLVQLNDFKGKVVVLEFWATWCSPCKRSMPGMQAVVNKYKDDDEVAFLFVDVFQQEPNYKELVEKFLTTNKYTFPVVFDKMNDPQNSVARAYGVNGIPHKTIIDKSGFIRFEGTGDLGDVEKTINELKAKIELVRNKS